MSDDSEYKLNNKLFINRAMYEQGYSVEECLAFIHLSNLKENNLEDNSLDKELSEIIRTTEDEARVIRKKVISSPFFQEVKNEF